MISSFVLVEEIDFWREYYLKKEVRCTMLDFSTCRHCFLGVSLDCFCIESWIESRDLIEEQRELEFLVTQLLKRARFGKSKRS